MTSMVNEMSVLAISELLSRYAFAVDDEDWDGLAQLFAPGATFNFTAFGLPMLVGTEQIRSHFMSMRHPIAHHAVNPLIETGAEPNEFNVRSKMIVVFDNGRVWVGEYSDTIISTPAGMRFSSRTGLQPRSGRSQQEKRESAELEGQ